MLTQGEKGKTGRQAVCPFCFTVHSDNEECQQCQHFKGMVERKGKKYFKFRGGDPK